LGRGKQKVSDWSQKEEVERWMREFEKGGGEAARMLPRVEVWKILEIEVDEAMRE
jgi:hypothetical protein